MSEQQQAAQSTNQAAEANQSQQSSGQNSQQQQSASEGQQQQQQAQNQQAQQQSADQSQQQQSQQQQQSVPEKYDLKAPEGATLAPEFVNEVSALAKELGLSNEKAQALLNSQYAKLSQAEVLQKQQLQERSDAWKKAALEDKEIGGEQLNQNIEMSSRVLKKYFPETVIKFINDSGFGNYPDFLRGFVRLGKAMGEDKIVIGGSGGDPGAQKSRAARMFDKSNHQ